MIDAALKRGDVEQSAQYELEINLQLQSARPVHSVLRLRVLALHQSCKQSNQPSFPFYCYESLARTLWVMWLRVHGRGEDSQPKSAIFALKCLLNCKKEV